ncbi:MAG: tetratricopeptide repeat protein [Deltaproteobacteria bacterium]|nr:tetratricopeptide repeat protein [Deltaproteobacteria bacterium]
MAQEDEGHSIEQDIERYRAMLERAPSSSVFAPLAESLRRGGFLDEALTICVEGLQKHPNHMSGKVALGRIYYDKGMLQEAKKEFEEVVKISPDNILAARILKEINDKTGEEKNSQELRADVLKASEGQEAGQDAGVESQNLQPAAHEPPPFKDEVIYTVTMAELLEKQGHIDEALKIYEEILKGDAKNEVVKQSINRLKSLSAVAQAGLHKKPLPEKKDEKKDAKDDERVKQLADWASKFKRGGR